MSQKIYTGIGLDPEVVEFLSQLARESQRPRSWLINAIIREKAALMEAEREARASQTIETNPPVIRL